MFYRRLPTEVSESIKQILPGYTGTPSPDPHARGHKPPSPRITSPSPRVRSALDNVDLRDSMNNDEDDITPRNSYDRVRSGRSSSRSAQGSPYTSPRATAGQSPGSGQRTRRGTPVQSPGRSAKGSPYASPRDAMVQSPGSDRRFVFI